MNHTFHVFASSDASTTSAILLPQTATMAALSSTSSLLAVILLVVLVIAAYLTYLKARLSAMKKIPPFEEVPTVPNVQ